jgi:hypothetical protein
MKESLSIRLLGTADIEFGFIETEFDTGDSGIGMDLTTAGLQQCDSCL